MASAFAVLQPVVSFTPPVRVLLALPTERGAQTPKISLGTALTIVHVPSALHLAVGEYKKRTWTSTTHRIFARNSTGKILVPFRFAPSVEEPKKRNWKRKSIRCPE
jgi:hypothetical protein